MAHDMYLTFDEYKDFGGTVDAAAWPPLEYACRKRIDRLTDSRVQNMAEIPGAVKLCVLHWRKWKALSVPWHRSHHPQSHRLTRMATRRITGMCRMPMPQPSR